MDRYNYKNDVYIFSNWELLEDLENVDFWERIILLW